jgi:hypothetical protein
MLATQLYCPQGLLFLQRTLSPIQFHPDNDAHRRARLAYCTRSSAVRPHTESHYVRYLHPRAPSCTSIFHFLPHLKRVEGPISCLPSIKNVPLELDVEGRRSLPVGNDKALKAWTSHLESLLNRILITQCSSLTVSYGTCFTNAYSLPWKSLTLMQSHRSSLLERLTSSPRMSVVLHWALDFRRLAKQGVMDLHLALPLESSRVSRLTSLRIESVILFLPPGLNWTLEPNFLSINYISRPVSTFPPVPRVRC